MYLVPQKLLNAALTLVTASLVVSLGASAADFVASNNDVTNHRASAPVLTFPPPLSGGDAVAGENDVSDQQPEWPILTSPTLVAR